MALEASDPFMEPAHMELEAPVGQYAITQTELNNVFTFLLTSQVEQQFSHTFRVTVLRAEGVTKGALGDLCES